MAWEVRDNPPVLSPFTIMQADFPECSKSGSAGAICTDHLLLQSSTVKASKLTASFLAMVPIASQEAAGGETPGLQPKGAPGWDPPLAENALQVPGEGRDTWRTCWTPDC